MPDKARILLLLFATGFLPGGITTANSRDAVCYQVANVDPFDVLYIRSRRDHRSDPVGAIAPDHKTPIRATGPCRPANASKRRQWCPVEYYPLPSVKQAGYIKAYFVVRTSCTIR